ncbi:MAG TPA: CBS domain-containing protein [Acidobacteriota bacterium]|nr:CBS domain-containing protein [Acidobacteriota bacterium]
MISTVADILKVKGSMVHTVDRNASALDAIDLMSERGVGSLVVMEGDCVRGIVTERDFLRKVILGGTSPKETSVGDIMTEKVIVAGPEDTVEQCMALMTEQRFRHLPVVDGGELAGIVSIGDLIKQVSRDRKVQIKYLTDYIADKYPG